MDIMFYVYTVYVSTYVGPPVLNMQGYVNHDVNRQCVALNMVPVFLNLILHRAVDLRSFFADPAVFLD